MTAQEIVEKFMCNGTEKEKEAAVTILKALGGFSIITAKETLETCKRLIDVLPVTL